MQGRVENQHDNFADAAGVRKNRGDDPWETEHMDLFCFRVALSRLSASRAKSNGSSRWPRYAPAIPIFARPGKSCEARSIDAQNGHRDLHIGSLAICAAVGRRSPQNGNEYTSRANRIR